MGMAQILDLALTRQTVNPSLIPQGSLAFLSRQLYTHMLSLYIFSEWLKSPTVSGD